MAANDLVWRGPHRWPHAGRQARIDDFEARGIYLFSVEHGSEYLVYCAGYTSGNFRTRFRQHDKLYRDGTYTIFDRDAFQSGRREKVWPGFWYKRPLSSALREEYARRREEIRAATERWLDGYRVFVAHVEASKRVLKRLEAGVMRSLYNAAAPACDMPDTGISLSSRWPSEAPIHVRNVATVRIMGLPHEMEV